MTCAMASFISDASSVHVRQFPLTREGDWTDKAPRRGRELHNFPLIPALFLPLFSPPLRSPLASLPSLLRPPNSPPQPHVTFKSLSSSSSSSLYLSLLLILTLRLTAAGGGATWW